MVLQNRQDCCTRGIDKTRSRPYQRAVTLEASTSDKTPAAWVRVAELEGELEKTKAALERATSELEKVRHAYRRALEDLQLMRRRLFVATAERPPSEQEQLKFEGLLAEVDRLAREAAEAAAVAAAAAADAAKADAAEAAAPPAGAKDPSRPKPKGRRNLEDTTLPTVRVELTDPELEGVAERIGFEESSRLGYERGGARRIILARAIYKVAGDAAPEGARLDAEEAAGLSASAAAEDTTGPRLVTAPLPKEMFRRGLLAPSMVAFILASKYVLGVPFYRLESKLRHERAPIDRGTMCRYAEDAGATLGAIVLAMRDEALATSFCLATDATGISIQPTPLEDGRRQACRKGHFFVVLADRDHVFFEYQPKHTSAAVCEMFKGFSGYIQADAHVIYDALYRGPPRNDAESAAPPPKEVGCWSHARRKWWEAAACKHRLGLDGLVRIDAIFAADRGFAKLAPAQRHALRQAHVRPLVDSFFEWARALYSRTRERGLVASAAGYAVRQEAALRRFLDDGRLRLDNNPAESALRPIATGRNAWLFCGSDDHASAAANLFSLIASCKLHSLDPEAYLAEVIRVMPYWPRDRYLELAPKYWARTRARLAPAELTLALGHVTVPAPATPEEQQPSG